MIRRIRDYIQLVAMCNSRIDHVRDLAQEMVNRSGWRVRPCAGKTWRMSFTTVLNGGLPGVITLWYNDMAHEPKGSTKVIRWCEAIGIIYGDGSQQAQDTAKAIRGKSNG